MDYPIETFTDEERALLEPHFTNLDRPVFALVNLPETVKGALFARYSRYQGTLRRLYLEEFAADAAPGVAFDGEEGERARKLYERIFIGYGDDSVAQLGGAHIACEWVSNVMTKLLQRGRLAAYLEQSTRYMAYDAPMGERPGYRYWRDPALGPEYEAAMDFLFDSYSEALPRVEAWAAERFPRAEGEPEAAHARSIRAKALDLLRGLGLVGGAREALGGPGLHARKRFGVGTEEEVNRRLVLGAELGVAPVAVAQPVGDRRVVGDVARGLLQIRGQPAALQQLRHHVRDPLAGDVRSAELGHRVVAVAEEDALVELAGALALLAVEGGVDARLGRELVQVEPAQRALVAGVAGEHRALDRLRQPDQREDRPVEVREMWLERGALRLAEALDGVVHAGRVRVHLPSRGTGGPSAARSGFPQTLPSLSRRSSPSTRRFPAGLPRRLPARRRSC